MKKKIVLICAIILLLSIALVLLAELKRYQTRLIRSEISLKSCSSAVLGLKFDYPKHWGDCRVDGQRIFFRTDFEEHKVDLAAEVREIDKSIDDVFIKEEKIVGINNSKIYNVACGGAIACTGLNINNDHFYEIDWDVASDQVAPKYLDGVWRPDYGFTSDDIWNILKSVKN